MKVVNTFRCFWFVEISSAFHGTWYISVVIIVYQTGVFCCDILRDVFLGKSEGRAWFEWDQLASNIEYKNPSIY